jgi:hypothetical protein
MPQAVSQVVSTNDRRTEEWQKNYRNLSSNQKTVLCRMYSFRWPFSRNSTRSNIVFLRISQSVCVFLYPFFHHFAFASSHFTSARQRQKFHSLHFQDQNSPASLCSLQTVLYLNEVVFLFSRLFSHSHCLAAWNLGVEMLWNGIFSFLLFSVCLPSALLIPYYISRRRSTRAFFSCGISLSAQCCVSSLSVNFFSSSSSSLFLYSFILRRRSRSAQHIDRSTIDFETSNFALTCSWAAQLLAQLYSIYVNSIGLIQSFLTASFNLSNRQFSFSDNCIASNHDGRFVCCVASGAVTGW